MVVSIIANVPFDWWQNVMRQPGNGKQERREVFTMIKSIYHMNFIKPYEVQLCINKTLKHSAEPCTRLKSKGTITGLASSTRMRGITLDSFLSLLLNAISNP